MTTNTNQDIPCKKCPVLAICVGKTHILCDKLMTYAARYDFDIHPVKELPHLEFLETGGEPLTKIGVKGVMFNDHRIQTTS